VYLEVKRRTLPSSVTIVLYDQTPFFNGPASGFDIEGTLKQSYPLATSGPKRDSVPLLPSTASPPFPRLNSPPAKSGKSFPLRTAAPSPHPSLPLSCPVQSSESLLIRPATHNTTTTTRLLLLTTNSSSPTCKSAPSRSRFLNHLLLVRREVAGLFTCFLNSLVLLFRL